MPMDIESEAEAVILVLSFGIEVGATYNALESED
jgi:hypothetical protein